jgi:AcrR family transcriptional regulator
VAIPGQAAAELRAVDGRIPGRRGRATRQRLLDCLETALGASSFRELTVTDVTRDAGTSPATFYQYFPDVATAILALAEQTAAEGESLCDLIHNSTWRGRSAHAAVRELVDGFLSFWVSHRSILRVVDLAAAEGDERFRSLRTRMLNDVVMALADVIRELQRSGKGLAEIDAVAMAGTLVAMLAHVAAHQVGFETWDIHVRDVRQSLEHLVYWGVLGKRPPRD